MALSRSVSSVGQIVLALVGADGVEQRFNASPRRLDRPRCGFSQELFQLGEDPFDGVQVWAIGWQEREPGADGADRFARGRPFVAAEIVHDHDVAGLQGRNEELLDKNGKAWSLIGWPTGDRPRKGPCSS
jgi:hypothetical protein